MADKIKLTVEEVLAEMTAARKENGSFKYNRFNLKNFQKLMKTMLNDPNFETKVAKVIKTADGEASEVTEETVEVTKGFRKFCKKIIEKAGVDKAESERILTEDFQFDNVDGLYEFFATAMYLYIEKGNRFDLLPKKDFKGSIYLKEVNETTTVSKARSPQTGDFLGEYETKKKKHKVAAVKSSCPKYLVEKKKL